MEKELGLTKAREQFGELVEQVQYQGDAIVISRNGKPAAAIVPMEVYENWKRQRRDFFGLVRQMQQRSVLGADEAAEIANEAIAAARKAD
jgi:prevent-host-death family protein